MRVAIYARVSTHDQDEALQIPRLESYCARMDYQVSNVYTDEASGKDANRPGWRALLSDARRGEFEAVIVTKLDRIMRSLTQLLDTLRDFEKRHVSIITLDQGIIDMSSANSRLQISIIAMVAEWEREIISERTKEALRAKKEKGVVLGRPKTGLPIHTIALMRVAGKSWNAISKELSIPRTNLSRHRMEIEDEAAVVATSIVKLCPSCGSNLSYVADMNYWCCTSCNYLEGVSEKGGGRRPPLL